MTSPVVSEEKKDTKTFSKIVKTAVKDKKKGGLVSAIAELSRYTITHIKKTMPEKTEEEI